LYAPLFGGLLPIYRLLSQITNESALAFAFFFCIFKLLRSLDRKETQKEAIVTTIEKNVDSTF